MSWKPLPAFRDPTIPKLHNLRRASHAGLKTPPWTFWAWAAELKTNPCPKYEDCCAQFPVIVRSASPAEDTHQTSNAGQTLSVFARNDNEFADALKRVVALMPQSNGRPLGAIFVQPVIQASVAGVTFFDGFYFEETRARGSNVALTSGQERGEVRRGHVNRGDPHHAWLMRIHRVFGGRLDIEWARPEGDDNGDPILLQVRPALFPIRRCETLSLANHKEILGDPPSPWILGVINDIARPVMRFFESVDPAVAAWDEPYAIELGGRSWLNFSVFFRLMDRWGLPRTMVTESVGGDSVGPGGERANLARMIKSLPSLVALTLSCFANIARIGREFRILEAELARAETLLDLQRANVHALEFSVRTNFAIMSVLSTLTKVRKFFGLNQAAHVVTQAMMAEYAAIASRSDLSERLSGLDDWLRRYGHRGPLESDPRHPRFRELRDVLQADLARGPARAPNGHVPLPGWKSVLIHPFFLGDEYREWFRDRMMRWWEQLRLRILAAGARAVALGQLDTPSDAFFLRGSDLLADPATWRAAVATRSAEMTTAASLELPATSTRDAIEAAIISAHHRMAPSANRFVGIGLGGTPVTGTAVRAAELASVLSGEPLPQSPVLIVDTLEPSWAVVFPRFSAVVSALGGELSHASILLREAGIPAVVNARGAYVAIADGDLIHVDPSRGEVRVEARALRSHSAPKRACVG